MSIESETETLVTEREFPFKLEWRVHTDYCHVTEQHPFEIPEGSRVYDITVRGKSVNLILPDTEAGDYDENIYFKDKHATSLSRKLFKLNDEIINTGQSYEEEVAIRKEIVNTIKERVPGIPSKFLNSMRRSFTMRAYNREKTIRQIEDNKPLISIEELTSNILHADETDDIIKNRKSKDSAVIFDKLIERKFKMHLRQMDENTKTKMGGINMLKDGYEYYLAKVIGNLLKSAGLENIGKVNSLEYIAGLALIKQQIDERKITIQYAVTYSDFDRINNEPLVSLDKSIEKYINNQIVCSSYNSI